MTELRFDGRVAVVTGAGNGLGRAYALLLAERGAAVLCNDLGGDIHGSGSDSGPANAIANEINDKGGEAIANTDTVANGAGGAAIIGQALDHWGHVDILINNAGSVVSRGPIDENKDEDFVADLMTGAGGTFFLTRAVWRPMWERNYGRILNVASSAFLGMMSSAGYPATKGAAWGLTRNLAHRAAAGGRDIKVNCIMPSASGRMTRLMGDSISTAMDRYYGPDVAAPAAGFLVHEEVPATGELFGIGGDMMHRIFIGSAPGIAAEHGQLSMEMIRDNWSQVMEPDGYRVLTNAFDEVSIDDRVPWRDGVGTVF